MSEATDKIQAALPSVQWTGASSRHLSRAIGFNIDEATKQFLAKSAPKVVMRVLARANYHTMVTRQIAASNLVFDPFMTEDEFNKLTYYLSMRSLLGQKPKMRGKRIVNPETENVFIPIGRVDEVVLAIRFWAGDEESSPGDFCLGFRVRVEVLSVDESHGRARAAIEEMQKVTEEVAEFSEVTEYTEVAEPISEEEAGLRVRIRES